MAWCQPGNKPLSESMLQSLLTHICVTQPQWVKTLRPRQNGCHFADDTFKRIFMNENARISINISLNFVPKGLINNIPALVQIMAWGRPGNKPLSEPMMVRLPTHICVTRPQWVKRHPICLPLSSSERYNAGFACSEYDFPNNHVKTWIVII